MSTTCDIAVIGSGAAGIAAAVTAARAGYHTMLFDKNPAPGGTGGFSGLTTLCGLYDDSGEYLNLGFAREFAEAIAETSPQKMGAVWVLPYRPTRFRVAAGKFFAPLPNLETFWDSPISNITAFENRIVSINGIRVCAVIDCSGSAEVTEVIGEESLATDDTTQAPAVVFPLHQVTREMLTPASRRPGAVAHRPRRLSAGHLSAQSRSRFRHRQIHRPAGPGSRPSEFPARKGAAASSIAPRPRRNFPSATAPAA